MTKLFKYVWLLLAVGAFIGVCRGATHHIFTFGISAIMYYAFRKEDKEEEKKDFNKKHGRVAQRTERPRW